MNKLQLGQSDYRDIDSNRWYAHLSEPEKAELRLQTWQRTCPVAKLI